MLKFMAVGASGVVVNLGLLWLLVSHVKVQEAVAGIFSIEASIVSNFLLNNFWTFRERKSGSFPSKMLKYHGSAALGAVINYATYVLLMAGSLGYLVAMTVGIFLGVISKYLLSEIFVWRPQQQ